MTPTQLADHLARLDWSMTSTEHRLAIVAAINELRGPLVVLPAANTNVTILRTKHHVRLLSLDGAELRKESFRDVREAWQWVVYNIAGLWLCHPEQVGATDDFGTIDGIPVCQIVHGLPEPFLAGKSMY